MYGGTCRTGRPSVTMQYIPSGKGLFTPSFSGQSHEVIFTLRSYDMNGHVGRHEVFIEVSDLHTGVLAIQNSIAFFSHVLSSSVRNTINDDRPRFQFL